MKEQLLKAASLLDEAASKLREQEAPEKKASHVVSEMVSKGFLSNSERGTYEKYLTLNPEKIAAMEQTLGSMPSRSIAPFGEVDSTSVSPSGLDPMDRFLHG